MLAESNTPVTPIHQYLLSKREHVMQDLPHHYTVTGTAAPKGDVQLSSSRLDTIISAPPEEFGGPGNQWSPETLLVAAVADCFILTFKAIARASNFEWIDLSCEVNGTLARVNNVTQFTHFSISPTLLLAESADKERAERLLQKSEQSCLITNSLSAQKVLQIQILNQPLETFV
jgi:peroxiredoxin-like protein